MTMLTVSADSLIAAFRTMYEEHWSYVWGKAEKGCVDCSGAFVYAFGTFGIRYPHGSNAIARNYIVGDMMPISEARPGMAAFKLRAPWEEGYDLPDKYKSGADKNDYYHIGLVDEDPDYVLNAKGEKAGFCRDKLTAKNGWDCVAYLKDVDYQTEEKMEQAKVVLPSGASGNTVNLRRVPSRSSDIIARVPVGSEVMVESDSGQWCQVTWGDKSGYMMSNYIEYTGQSGESDILTADQMQQIDRALSQIEAYVRGITEQTEIIGSLVGRG